MNKYLPVLLSALLTIINAGATAPPTKTPDTPPFSISEAAKLGDEYVAHTFPQFPTLYCSEIVYETDPMAMRMTPNKIIVWRLRYIIPNNPRLDVPGKISADWGYCSLLIYSDKSVAHLSEPKQNP